MSNRSDLVFFNNVVDNEDLEQIYKDITGDNNWAFAYYTMGEGTGESPNPIYHVIKDKERRSMGKFDHYYDFLVSRIEAMVSEFDGREIEEFHTLNFQITYKGHHGFPHTDYGSGENSITCVIFLSPEWDQEWDGEFKIEDRDGKWVTIPYAPGGGVAFDPSLLHTGVGANTKAAHVRLICAAVVHLKTDEPSIH